MTLEYLESLLLKVDEFFAQERSRLIDQFRKHEEQIHENEKSIRDTISEIALLELRRTQVTEMQEEYYLTTIEYINLADIRIERENLSHENQELSDRLTELRQQEAELLKDKEKIDERKRKKKLPVAHGK